MTFGSNCLRADVSGLAGDFDWNEDDLCSMGDLSESDVESSSSKCDVV